MLSRDRDQITIDLIDCFMKLAIRLTQIQRIFSKGAYLFRLIVSLNWSEVITLLGFYQ